MILPQGHYTLKTLAKEIQNVFSEIGLHLQTQINHPVGSMVIENPDNRKIVLGRNLSELLGIGSNLLFKTFFKRLRSPSAYFIHCDLVNKEQNLLNGSPSSVLARFDIKGDAYEKINYQTTQDNVLCDTSSDEYVNSVTLSVRSECKLEMNLKKNSALLRHNYTLN